MVGAWNTGFAYIAYVSLYWLLHRHVHYLVISVLTHVAAVTNAFVCQRSLVFRAQGGVWWSAFLKFNLVQLGILAGGLAAVAFLVEIAHFPPFASQSLVMVGAVLLSYLANLHFTFRD